MARTKKPVESDHTQVSAPKETVERNEKIQIPSEADNVKILTPEIKAMIETVVDLTKARNKLESEFSDLGELYLSSLNTGADITETADQMQKKANEIIVLLARTVSYYTKSIPAMLAG